MRKVIASVAAATMLVFATVSSALAAGPDGYRDRSSGSEYDDFTSAMCGFDIWLTWRVDFNIGIGPQGNGNYFHAERTRTGSGGTIRQVVHFTFLYPDGFQVIGDPDSGYWIEIIREIGVGSLVWSTPGDGVIYRVAGYAEATVTMTFTPDSEELEVSDEVFHGQTPASLSEDELNALLCDTLS